MSVTGWRGVLIGVDPADGLAELFDALESEGWSARRRVGNHGLCFWPDQGRAKQISIDTRYPLNEHKLEYYREHTQLALNIEITEGGKQ